jgi:hypothetical protein
MFNIRKFSVLLLFYTVTPATYKYQLTIGAMFQNEAPHLKEWIEFHKLVGVEHFYLYNNASTDNYFEILKPYIEKKEIDLIQWPFRQANWLGIQLKAHTHMLAKARAETKWLALLDLDEFLFPVQKDNIQDFLKDYEQFGGVCVNWQMYGTSKVAHIPLGKLMTETLVFKAPTNHEENSLGKVICRPDRVHDCLRSTHIFNYKPGYFQVTPDKKRCYSKRMPSITIDKARINHYWTRDEYNFRNFKIPRRVRFGSTLESCERVCSLYNQVRDESILRFVDQLRQRVFVS